MSWTDQTPQVATEEHLQLCWSGGRPGERFRCYLCGYKFVLGDTWRFVFDNGGSGSGNFLVCEICDCDDIRDRWKLHCEAGRRKYWWMFRK
jgi:hypothetical protein